MPENVFQVLENGRAIDKDWWNSSLYLLARRSYIRIITFADSFAKQKKLPISNDSWDFGGIYSSSVDGGKSGLKRLQNSIVKS